MHGRHTRPLSWNAEVIVMVVVRVCVIVLSSLVLVPCAAVAQQASQDQRRGADAIPANVEPRMFAGDLRALLRLSETFRSQCERIAADPRLRVHLSVVSTVDGGGRAQTMFRRYPSGTLVADVDVLFGANYRELIAHEFEHILEQLDGVDLRHEAAGGGAWEVAAGVFETRRATLAGAVVLRETEMMHAHPAAVVSMR
jgi:hypothetical protein